MSENNQNHNVDAETQEMLRSFVSEGLDSLDTNEPIVEHLRDENNSEYVNAIFRVFHTLKGLSGFFEMMVINKLTHEAETLLDIMRKQNSVQSEETISVIYSTFDLIRALLQMVNDEFTDKGGEEESENMILVLKDMIEKIQNPDAAAEDEEAEEETPEDAFDAAEPEDEFDEEPEETAAEDEFDQPETEEDSAEEDSSEPVVDGLDGDDLISDDMLDNYITSATELIDKSETNFLLLEKEPDNKQLVQETFGAIHSLKGNSGFMGFSEIEEISVEMETILDSVRNGDLDIDQTVITIMLSNIETIRDRIEKIQEKASSEGKKDEPKAQKPKEEPKAKPKPKPEPKAEKPKEKPKPEPKAEKPKEKPKIPKIPPKPTSLQTMQRKDIRVETDKIDKLFDLVGELLTIETIVTNNPDLQGLELPNFNKSANMLNKIARDLQEITMSIRMMPLEGLFNKMKRLVRDVSIKMEKKVEFEVSGQETEMDKNVIDEIADPLVHILRNAVDHGVETPEERSENGKPETGHVKLSARYEGNEILIIVEDDGKGINKEAVLNKAIEKGLITTDPEKLSDKEIYLLVFEPGFSTAKEVTDISGRGVGMDVVKKNLEKLRGAIDVESNPGKGSVFTLRIPLTLAIMEAMIIRIGESKYALPILSVNESFRITKKQISHTMDGLEVVQVREDVMPVIRLYELFNKKPDSTDIEKGILIMIESRDKQVCLLADEIVGQQQAVIKGLSDYIGKVPGITGCMILGDGGIGLILDIESLIGLSETPVQ